MPTPKDFQKFFEKRGFSVHKVVEGYDGFAVYIDRPESARKIFDSVADSSSLVFVSHKRWWQKLTFWRK